MNKILLILQREYLVRVKKKSFIIMTILGPLLIGGMYAGAIWLTVSDDENRAVEVVDESGLLGNKLLNQKNLFFIPSNMPLEEAKKGVLEEKYYAVLHIPKELDLENPSGIKLFAKKSIGFDLENAVENALKKEIEDIKLLRSGIDKEVLRKIDTKVAVSSINLSEEEGEKGNNTGAAMVAGFAGAFLIYMSIFIYGVQVMRGVIEEKTSRIVEVIISSVKPFQLMLGKILGIALVGLTQFLVWIIFGFVVTGAVLATIGTDKLAESQSKVGTVSPGLQRVEMMNNLSTSLDAINLPLIVACFIFFFLGGYLIYSALFAAVGAAADSETDTQQFMLPITIPLILSFVLAQAIIRNPDSTLAFWLSIIPLTSPIIMMVRLPFGVPPLELIASMLLLIAGFLLITWVASRIYRVGILMYGKKVNYKELAKWVFYKS